LATVGAAVMLGFLGTLIYAVVAKGTGTGTDTQQQKKSGRNITKQSVLDFYNVDDRDGLQVEVVKIIDQNDDQFPAALQGSPHMLSTSVVCSRTSDGIHFEDLEVWLSAFYDYDKAIKLDLSESCVLDPTLDIITSMEFQLHQPVWIHGKFDSDLTGSTFINSINSKYPDVTIVLQMPTKMCGGQADCIYTWSDVDEMYQLAKDTTQLVVFAVDVGLVQQSWPQLLWLLEQTERFSLLLQDVVDSGNIISNENLLYIRDNSAISSIFYEDYNTLTRPLQNELESNDHTKVFYSGGNVLEFFRIEDRDAIEVTWAHRVNNVDELDASLSDDNILMLEADVRVYGEGTAKENKSLPVMCHDLNTNKYELTLVEWLEKVNSWPKPKGIKLDFKSIEGLEAALPVLNRMKDQLQVPIWINGDVLPGPNCHYLIKVNADLFFTAINEFPDITISPGWNTRFNAARPNEEYTEEMIQSMYSYVKDLRQPITFPVRASLCKDSIPRLQWLLSQSNRFSITIWSGSEEATVDDLLIFYNSFKPDKVFFDIPSDLLAELKQKIRDQN